MNTPVDNQPTNMNNQYNQMNTQVPNQSYYNQPAQSKKSNKALFIILGAVGDSFKISEVTDPDLFTYEYEYKKDF